jgi:hypothetical protein
LYFVHICVILYNRNTYTIEQQSKTTTKANVKTAAANHPAKAQIKANPSKASSPAPAIIIHQTSEIEQKDKVALIIEKTTRNLTILWQTQEIRQIRRINTTSHLC